MTRDNAGHNPRHAGGITRTVNAAVAHHQAGHFDRAERLYRNALDKDPQHSDALHLLGVVTLQRGDAASAIALIERALPDLLDLPEAHLNLGNALMAAGRHAEAAASFRRAIALAPDYGMAHNNLAHALIRQGDFLAGLEHAKRAVALIPDFLGAHVNFAAALMGLRRFAEAEGPLRRAVDLAPAKAEALHDLGEVVATLGRLDEAAAIYRRALTLDHDHPKAHLGLGTVLKRQGKLNEAIACFERAVGLDPGDPVALSAWFSERQTICDWSRYLENEPRVRNAVLAQPSFSMARTLLGLQSTPAEQLACAHQIAAKVAAPKTAVLPRRLPRPKRRIRLGYLSADFRQHATAFLIAGLIEHHDRRSFEVAGYSSAPNDASAMRTRISGAFDRFVEIDKIAQQEAAELIYADGVDILIDLNGYTGSSVTSIPAYRPAPIQVNYLGYPGTMGANFVDYIIVDRFVVPSDQQSCFSERLVHLPDCYQCNDDTRAVAERTPLRANCDLPEKGFVFCCFNNSYKITPTFFDIWMRLLNGVVFYGCLTPTLGQNLTSRGRPRRGVWRPNDLCSPPRNRRESTSPVFV
jgi:predicted O-linked N-acetylglucosamine transferase (SPINDLY family)